MTTLLLAALLAHRTPTLADVIANVRTAVAITSPIPKWEETDLKGTSQFRGVSSGYELRFEPNGKFVQAVDSKLGQTFGWDGRNFWEIDLGGATRHLAFEDVDRVQSLVFLLTDFWLDTSAPLDLSLASSAPSKGLYTIISTSHVSGLEERIDIDAKTWLPVSAEFDIAASKTKISLSDWKVAGGIRVPTLARQTAEGLTDTFRVEEIHEAKASPASTFTIPAYSPKDIEFRTDLPSSIECKRAESGHILLHPLVNGKDIGWFILDSGADSMIIDKAAADTLNLPKIGKETVVGVGGAVQEPFRTASDLKLGPATMRGLTFLEIDLHALSDLFKVKLAGIIGFDFFRRFIVQVDLKTPAVDLFDVSTYHLQRGDWSKMEFSSGNPVVQATFEGDRKGWFRLDTGANGKVVFHSPAVEKLKLLDHRETSAVGMAGVGGTSDARMGKLAWFELGGHRFEAVDAVFSQAKTGAFADRYLTGNIGQDLMEPFTVVFDFGGSRVAFLPH